MRKITTSCVAAALASASWCSAEPLADNFADLQGAPVVTVEAVEGKASSPLYAVPILQGGVNEHISVTAMSESGDRAILQRITPGLLVFSGSTEIQLMTRSGRDWAVSSLLSRKNGNWIGGVTLSALAFSADGRHLIFRVMKDLKDYQSTVIKALDIDSGKETMLGPGRGGTVLDEDLRETAKVVSESEWFKRVYPGASYEDVFADSKKRCAEGVKAVIEDRRTMIVSKEGVDPFVYPLKSLPGTRAWAWQSDDYKHSMAKDCARGLATVQEVLESESPSFFYGRNAYDARMRVMEFGLVR